MKKRENLSPNINCFLKDQCQILPARGEPTEIASTSCISNWKGGVLGIVFN